MRYLIIFFFLAACGRPLTVGEAAFAARIHGPDLNVKKVRLHDNAPLKSYTLRNPKRPRLTCTERIYPAPTTDFVTGAPSAVALFNRIFVNPDYTKRNYF